MKLFLKWIGAEMVQDKSLDGPSNKFFTDVMYLLHKVEDGDAHVRLGERVGLGVDFLFDCHRGYRNNALPTKNI